MKHSMYCNWGRRMTDAVEVVQVLTVWQLTHVLVVTVS